jgi:hypothetical protein
LFALLPPDCKVAHLCTHADAAHSSMVGLVRMRASQPR